MLIPDQLSLSRFSCCFPGQRRGWLCPPGFRRKCRLTCPGTHSRWPVSLLNKARREGWWWRGSVMQLAGCWENGTLGPLHNGFCFSQRAGVVGGGGGRGSCCCVLRAQLTSAPWSRNAQSYGVQDPPRWHTLIGCGVSRKREVLTANYPGERGLCGPTGLHRLHLNGLLIIYRRI